MTKIKGRLVTMDSSDDSDDETIEKQDGQKSALKPQMASIFAEVEQNLPSLDFDFGDMSSDSEVSEEPLIFHRNLKTSDYLDEDKDLDTSQSEEMLADKRAESPPFKSNELSALVNGASQLKDNSVDLSFDNGKLQHKPNTKLDAWNTEIPLQCDPHDDAKQTEDSDDKKDITKDIKKDQKDDEKFSEFLKPETPTLSLNVFENLDLDLVLETLNEDNQYGPPRSRAVWSELTSVAAVRREAGDSEKDANPSEGLTMIEKLAALSVKQGASGLTEINPQTGAISKYHHDIYHVDNKWLSTNANKNNSKNKIQEKEVISKKTCSMGTNTSDLTQRPPQLQLGSHVNVSKSETVFIDLRGFEKHREEEKQNMERVQAILHLKNKKSTEDSSESEDETERWIKERKKIKQKLVSRGVTTETLPNKHQSPPGKNYKQPHRVINMLDRTSNNLDQSKSDTSLPDQSQVSIVDNKTRQKELMAQREKERQMEVARKLREEREKEREHRIKLSHRLEAVRPTASVTGRQAMAEATPTLYDLEASYEPAASTLPRVTSLNQPCLLLKIHLASNGEIILHKNRTNQSVDTGEGLSASYTTLLSWLTSLVPDNFTYLQRAAQDKPVNDTIPYVPFYVIGLQQIWLEEKFYLTVAITPTEHFDPKLIQSHKSKKYQGGNPFMQYIHNFLTGNTLHTVCPWLQGLISMEVTGPGEDNPSSKSYSYCPPLPNVTDKPLASFIEVHSDPQAACRIFNMAVGFYWQTIDTEEGMIERTLDDGTVDYETQNTMSLVYKKIYRDPVLLMGIMIRILQEGLDLAGVRLLYPTAELLNLSSDESSGNKSDLELLNNVGPVLALAIRGTFARSIWLDAVGPSDPVLARKTDPNSLCAQYGGSSRDESLLFCPRNSSRVLSEMTRWFGGRVPPGGSINVGTPYERKEHLRSGSPKSRKGKRASFSEVKPDHDDIPTQRPLATLTATTKSDLFLVVSPLFPPKAMGILLATCQRRGYQTRGVKRMRLSNRRAEVLGINSEDVPLFCGEDLNRDYPSTVFLLEKENASHNAASLIEAFMVQLTLKGLMDDIQEEYSKSIGSKQLFYAATYTDDILSSLGGDFTRSPDYDTQCGPSYIQPTFYTNPELEQIVIVILHGYNIQKSCGLFIGQLLNVTPYGRTPVISTLTQGMELLGLKWLPYLTNSQAKEVTPIEVGDKLWKDSIHRLTSEPAFVLALRGVGAFKQLESMVPPGVLNQPNKTPLHKLMSHTAEEAYTFARLFFSKHELYIDNLSRPLLPYIPESLHFSSIKKPSAEHKPEPRISVNIFDIMKCGSCPIKTFLLIKPGAVKKHPLAKFLKKFGQEGFRVVGLKLDVLDAQKANVIIQSLEIEDEEVQEKHLSHLTSGPSVLICLERENSIKKLVDIIGPDDPQAARRKSQFLWRGIFGSDPVANGLYGSVDYCTAVKELEVFFPELSTQLLDNSQQEEVVEDSIIDVDYNNNRQISINHDGHSLHYEDSTMAGIHATLLLQTNCILLTPPLLSSTPRSKGQGYVEVIESLQTNGFEIIGARMVNLSQTQAEQFLCLSDAGSFKQVPLLLMGPCIVLAIQRDNAVVAFNSIFESTVSGDALLKKYGQFILCCSTVKQAHKLLPFFFDSLMPGSQITITTNKPIQA